MEYAIYIMQRLGLDDLLSVYLAARIAIKIFQALF